MNKGPFILFRVFGLLLVLGLIAGAGAFGYKAGMARGIEQAPVVAAAIEKAAEEGAPLMPMYGYGYTYGYPHGYGLGHPHFFNPFFAICFSFLFIFLFFGAMKMIFFRRMRHNWSHYGHWEGNIPPFFNDWHKRAHGKGEKPMEEKKEEDR